MTVLTLTLAHQNDGDIDPKKIELIASKFFEQIDPDYVVFEVKEEEKDYFDLVSEAWSKDCVLSA